MNTDKLIAIFLTVLMVGSAFAFAQPVAAQDSGPTVTLQPSDGEVQPGEAQTYEIVVENADNDVGSYDIDVSLSDTGVGTFSSAEAGLNGDTLDDSATVEDGSVNVNAAYTGSVASGETVATVTVSAADAEGSADLSVTVNALGDADNNNYTDFSTEGATLTVAEPDEVPEDQDVGTVSIPDDQSTIVDAPPQHFTNGDLAQDNIQRLSDGNAQQTLLTDLTLNETAGMTTVVIDYSQSENAGLEIPEEQADDVVGDGPLDGVDTDVEIRNAVGEVEITFDSADTGDVVDQTQEFNLEFTGSVAPEGDDGSIEHIVEIDGVSNSDTSVSYRLTARGATAIAPEDALNGGGIDLSEENGPVAEEIEPDRTGTQAAFDIWQDQQLTFQTEENGNVVAIYEYEVESAAGDNDVVRRGDRVTRVGTAPGSTTNLDTSQLEAGTRYIVEFEDYDGYADDAAPVVVLDVDPLNLNASAAGEFQENQPVEIDVTSDDITGGDVTALFFDENFNFITSINDEMDGDGETTVRANASEDLEGLDDYFVVIQHDESEVTTAPIAFSVVEAPDEEVTIASPRPEAEQYTRGDIIPIQLEFTNTDTGTLTFGDRTSPQNLEIQVTVRDANEDGTATIYLNTFQIGHGAETTCDPSVDFDDCDSISVPNNSRNHGFFTHPDDDGSALVGEEGQTAVAYGPALDIEGGSQGGAIVFPQNYDLVTTAGTESYKDDDQFLNDKSIVRTTEARAEGITTWTAPGIGENRIDPELTSDVQEAVDAGIITPADSEIAAEDFYVLQLEAEGLEGLMHEAVIQDPDLETEDFLPAPGESRAEDLGDHLITEEFFAAQDLTTADGEPLLDFTIQTQETNESVEARTDPNEALDPTILDIRGATTGVVAATDDSGNLNEYYIPLELESGTELSRAGTWFGEDVDGDGEPDRSIPSTGDSPLAPGLQFDSRFILNPTNTQQGEVPANDPLANGLDQTDTWDYIPASATVDQADPVLVVPQEQGVEISGTTKVAAGTNLTISMATVPAEDPPFFKQHPAVFPEYNEEGDNTWSVTEDFADFSVGTNFEITIRRTGAAGQLTADTDGDGQGDPVPGAIGEVRAVGEFTFADQDSGGQSVVVDSFQAPYDSIIQILDADGNQIGLSNVIEGGENAQSNIAISLDEQVSENQELTAVAWLAENGEPVEQYMSDGEPVNRTAQVTVDDPLPADFAVSDLQPTDVTIPEPADQTVSATITNEGEQEATQTVRLLVDGETVATAQVTLAGGESTTQEFGLPADALDFGTTYVHSVESEDDSATSSLTVEEEDTPTPEPPTPTPEPPTPTPEPPTDTPTDTETATATEEDSDDGAGFGIVVAMLAFLGAALLAVRRRTDE